MKRGYLRIGLCNISYYQSLDKKYHWESDNGFKGESKFIKDITTQYHEAKKIHKSRTKNIIDGVWNPIYGYKCVCDCNKEIYIK